MGRSGVGEAAITKAHKKFKTKIRIYWADCDAAGIVYYGNFFSYFEYAEEELFLSQGRGRPDVFHQCRVGFPRAETWCRFRKPVKMGDLIEVTAWIAKRTRRSMQYCFEVRRDGETEVLAEGNYTVVCINRQFEPVPLPQEVLDLLGDYLPPVTEGGARK
jgi:YbgC/YbaW family acyl-CoA thioester hydrolase